MKWPKINPPPRSSQAPELARPGVSARRLALSALAMLAAIAALHFTCLHFYPKKELDIFGLSDFYPLSVFAFRRPLSWQALWALAYAGAFLWLWPRMQAKAGTAKLIAAGLLLAFMSNMLHGWRHGIDYPTAAWGATGIEYYHDAIRIKGPLWFLERFNVIQSRLLEHARTHPPGPVLLYYFLHRTLGDPGLISIGIGAIALALSVPALRRLMRLAFGAEFSDGLFLYALLPAVLIYGIAVVDVVIAGLFLQAVVHFVETEKRGSAFCAAGFLALSCFFTFGAFFLLPVMFGFELLRRKSVARSLAVVLMAALLLAALKPLFGFNWLQSFFKASAMENEQGFLLFADPRKYFWYRIGAVAEILFFFTPFLCVLGWRGVRQLKEKAPDFYTLFWLGPLALSAMLLSGTMKIGEAARICVFILPFLILPVWAAWQDLDDASRRRTAGAVVAWGMLMQLFGSYHW